jgi:hypothetical protein
MRYPLVILLVACSLAPTLAVAQGSSSTATGISNQMNPAISVNGLFWAQVSRDSDDPHLNRVALQEAEAQFTSIVDPFWKANVIVAVHPAHPHDDAASGDDAEDQAAGEETHGGFELDVEEAYIDGRSLPAGLALRLGKFFLPFGKHVPLHTHQFPFVQAPLGVTSFLGEHGLTEAGAQLTASLPLPWYSDLAVYGVNGDAEIFDAEDRDLVYGGRWRNLWDLSDAATLEVSGSLLHGPDGVQPGEFQDLDVFGFDLTYKWISPRRSKGPAVTLQGELILPRPEAHPGDPLGWYALAQYRFHRNWWLGVTYGQADGDPAASVEEHHHAEKTDVLLPLQADGHDHAAYFAGETTEYKLNLTFVPSEFSALRAEVAYFDDRHGDADDLRLLLQWNFTIGSHPAHLY